jgi:hypothetical protein
MDNVISQAQATLGSLMTQRSTFGGITSKISNVSSRLPTVCITYPTTKQLILYCLTMMYISQISTQPGRLTTSSRPSEGRNPWTPSFFRSLRRSAHSSSSSTGCLSSIRQSTKVLQCCTFWDHTTGTDNLDWCLYNIG